MFTINKNQDTSCFSIGFFFITRTGNENAKFFKTARTSVSVKKAGKRLVIVQDIAMAVSSSSMNSKSSRIKGLYRSIIVGLYRDLFGNSLKQCFKLNNQSLGINKKLVRLVKKTIARPPENTWKQPVKELQLT
jgi:hypothetical protein